MALRSIVWAFAKKPLRRYHPPVEGQHATPNIFFTVFDRLDIHLDHRFLGLPLGSVFSARVRCIWLATRLGTAGPAWSAHGRVRGLWINT